MNSNILPPIFHNLFFKVDHNADTRQAPFNYKTPAYHNRYGLYSPINVLIHLWNALPSSLKDNNLSESFYRKEIFNLLKEINN